MEKIVATLTLIVHAVIGFAFALFYGFGILSETSVGGLIIIVAFLLFSALVAFSIWRHNKRDQKPSVVTQAYRSWKEKHCVPVVIK